MPDSFPDKTRGVLNEGGLFGERQGWHLPGFDISQWTPRNISEGLPGGAAGVGFFVTTFDLKMPTQVDVPISFVFDEDSHSTIQPYRAILFVNGWMMGKRVGNLGCVRFTLRFYYILKLFWHSQTVLKRSFRSMKASSTITAKSEHFTIACRMLHKVNVLLLTALLRWRSGQWKRTRKSLQP